MAVAHGNARCAAMKEMQANLIAAKNNPEAFAPGRNPRTST